MNNPEKVLDFVRKNIEESNKEKITIVSELDCWYGMTLTGEKCAITDISLEEYVTSLNNEELLEKVKSEYFIVMPDGAKFGKRIIDIRNNDMPELAAELTYFAKMQNIRNGFGEPDPNIIEEE